MTSEADKGEGGMQTETNKKSPVEFILLDEKGRYKKMAFMRSGYVYYLFLHNSMKLYLKVRRLLGGGNNSRRHYHSAPHRGSYLRISTFQQAMDAIPRNHCTL